MQNLESIQEHMHNDSQPTFPSVSTSRKGEMKLDRSFLSNQMEQQMEFQQMMSGQQQQPSQKRWEQLYEMNQRKQEARQIIKQIVDEENKYDDQCTFKPTLIANHSEQNRMAIDQYQQAQQKEVEKSQKINQQKKQAQQDEMMHCTFQPKLSNNNHLNSHKNQVGNRKGVDSFIRRQKTAIQEKERKKEVFNQNHVVTNKKGGVTIPVEFKLTAQKSKQRLGGQQRGSESVKTFNREKKLYVTEVPFNEAVDYLHNALHSIDLE